MFYIYVDSHERLIRAIQRAKSSGESTDEVCRRYLSDMVDFSPEQLQKFKSLYTIDNSGSTDYTKNQLSYFIEAHVIESFYDFPGQAYVKSILTKTVITTST